jgi:hypothetical protein
MIILIITYILFIAFAGYCNAIMDLITPLDRLAHRGFIWSKTAMEFSKDANKDGKISWWENSFPKDKWHQHKRKMNIAIGLSCSCLIPIGYLIKSYDFKEYIIIIISFLCTPLFFFLFSFMFETFYTLYKKL